MNKFDALWDYVQRSGRPSLTLSFQQIEDVLGIPIDHSFLNCKKELAAYGYQVGKISRKAQTVVFTKL